MRKFVALAIVFILASTFGAFDVLAQEAETSASGFQAIKQ